MIETHVVNAILLPEIKDGAVFKVLTFINGLVAPSFLFCAGFALAITLHRKWTEYIQFHKSLLRYIVRLLFILVVGYSLHLPFFSLRRLISITDDRLWVPFYQADILQTISITLLSLLIFVLITRKKTIFASAAILVSLLVIFLSPVIREMDHSSLPAWFRPYLTPNFKSQFPLFPWSAFLICGTIVGYFFMKVQGSLHESKFMKRLTLAGVLGILIALGFEILPVSIYPNHDFWRASPEFFFVRLGLVVLFLGMLWVYEQRRKVASGSVFTLFGQESLLVYTVHLLVVYGYTYEWSFVRYFGPTLNYPQSFGLFLALTGAMYLFAFAWHWLKGWNLKIAKNVQFVTLAIIVLTFLLKTT